MSSGYARRLAEWQQRHAANRPTMDEGVSGLVPWHLTPGAALDRDGVEEPPSPTRDDEITQAAIRMLTLMGGQH